jgi:Tfp pilus assembly protein PilO
MTVDRIIQLSRAKRRVLLSSLVVIAAIALYRWILSPYSGQLFAAQQYKWTLDNTIHKTRVLGTTLKAKREKVGELTEEFDRRQNELFTQGEMQGFFGSLQAVARRSGCVIQSVTSVADEKPGSQNQRDASGIISRKAVITINGGYGNIIKFLRELQTYKRKVWIESFKMDASGNSGKLKCQVVLMLYCIERAEATLYE